MDDEEESFVLGRPQPIEHSNDVVEEKKDKMNDTVLSNSQEIEVVTEMEDESKLIEEPKIVPGMDDSHSQLVGTSSVNLEGPKIVENIDELQEVGNPPGVDDSVEGNESVDGMDGFQLLEKPLAVEDMEDLMLVDTDMENSHLIENRPVVEDTNNSKLIEGQNVVVSMEVSQLVGNLPLVANMDDSKLVGNPNVVSGTEDLQVVENPSIDAAQMEDSQSICGPNVVAGTDESQRIENLPIAAGGDDSKLTEGPNGDSGMEDSQLVGNSPVVADKDNSELVGDPNAVSISTNPQKVEDLTKKDNSELNGGSVDTVGMDVSRLDGGSSDIPKMDDSEVAGVSADIPDMDDSEVVGGSPIVDDPSIVGSEATPLEEVVDMEEETDVAETTKGGQKRRRGRSAKAPVRTTIRKKTEEDVCFICFDGGDLVLCDRRGCPKAYHPVCVNRDEAFFRSKGRWNCGWHLCSNCEKAARYMCYTCTYSLCKGCTKVAEFSCVRGNKGFCQTCMGTVMLIETKGHKNKETSKVNFDDKSSWEYLFKDYYLDLKGKLSLTLDELTQARNPSKGSGVSARKGESSDEYNVNNDQGSDSDSGTEHIEVNSSKRKKAKRKSKASTKEEVSSSAAISAYSDGTSTANGTEWASKELLEFVSHMKNGDTSILSQFDVQALLLDYIKQNNLRDPRRKSQIICDARLKNLFGKPRVGHFEMLKLLESHFFLKEDAQVDDQEVNADTEASQFDTEVSTKAGTDKKRKSRKKAERGLQTNVEDYAAIDVHNISLIYLKRSLLEDLLEDMDTFKDKVVGSFVRIKITGAGQKQDMYRLVQVVGTGKAMKPYETSKKATDVTLEILNLNKTEVETIDRISSQDFSEDECKRLRQSIKCGFIAPLTVGDIQDKAMALQAARVTDLLEAEKLRLSHLRDRASDTGRRKELRECVEKLQILNTPEERLRRLQEFPEIHTDPNMDPSYESEEEEPEPDDKLQDNYRPRDAGFSRKGRDPISPGKGGSNVSDTWSGSRKNSSTSWEPSRNTSTRGSWEKRGGVEGTNVSTWNQGRDSPQSSSQEKSRSRTQTTGLGSDSWSGQGVAKTEQSSQITPPSLSTGTVTSSSISEAEKIWHYKDPSGKIQGPFSVVQLRKWSTTGYFPTNLRIWRTTEREEDSIPLTDALNGKFQKEAPQRDNNLLQSQKVTSGSDITRVSNLNGNLLQQIVKPDRIDFQNPPTPTTPTSGGSWRNVGLVGQSPNFGVNVVQQSVVGPMKDAVEWREYSPTPASGGHDSGSVFTSISPPVKPSEAEYHLGPTIAAQNTNLQGSNPLNNNSVDIKGFVQSSPVPSNVNMATWNSSGNGYNQLPDSAHQMPNTIDPRLGVAIPQQEWGPSSQQQEIHGPNATMPAQAGNYLNPNFPVSNSAQQPFVNWSPTPNTQSINPWGTIQNVQPSQVAPNPNVQPSPSMPVAPQMQLPSFVTVPQMQTAPIPGVQHMQQHNVGPNQGWGPPQGNTNMGWGGPMPVQGNMNMATWGTPPPPQPQSTNVGNMQQGRTNSKSRWGPPVVNNMGNQQQQDGNRYSSHQDRGGSHGGGGESNQRGGGRQSWNRQSSFGGGGGSGERGGGGSFQKGQRICVYYESGTCRRGADCDYIHPS